MSRYEWRPGFACCVHLVLGVLTPWAIATLPFPLRLAAVGALGVGAVCAWLLAWRSASTAPMASAAWWAAVAGAAAWIGVFSFSAEISKPGLPVVYGVVLGLTGAPFLVTSVLVRPEARRRTRALLLAGWLLLGLNVLAARPARRYEASHADINAAAASVRDVRAAVAWVHGNVAYRKAPFTDTARATLVRGEARCGGMANLLEKLIRAKEVPCRIVHVRKGRRIHTLVEYYDETADAWVLADGQENELGIDWDHASGLHAVGRETGSSLPRRWAGYEQLFVYVPRRGYVEVTTENLDAFYPGHPGDRTQ